MRLLILRHGETEWRRRLACARRWRSRIGHRVSLSMVKEHRGRPELTLWNFVLRQATG